MNIFDILMMVIFLFIHNWSITSADQHLAFFFFQLYVWENFPYPYIQIRILIFLTVTLRFDIFIHVFLVGPGSSRVRGWGFSLQRPLLLHSMGSRLAASVVVAHEPQQLPLLGSRAQVQKLQHTGFIAPWPAGSSLIRDRTCVSWVGRWILYHWATREASVYSAFCTDVQYSIVRITKAYLISSLLLAGLSLKKKFFFFFYKQ